jgi:hypothetical protein
MLDEAAAKLKEIFILMASKLSSSSGAQCVHVAVFPPFCMKTLFM